MDRLIDKSSLPSKHFQQFMQMSLHSARNFRRISIPGISKREELSENDLFSCPSPPSLLFIPLPHIRRFVIFLSFLLKNFSLFSLPPPSPLLSFVLKLKLIFHKLCECEIFGFRVEFFSYIRSLRKAEIAKDRYNLQREIHFMDFFVLISFIYLNFYETLFKNPEVLRAEGGELVNLKTLITDSLALWWPLLGARAKNVPGVADMPT